MKRPEDQVMHALLALLLLQATPWTDRASFHLAMNNVNTHMKPARVLEVLGKPDDIWTLDDPKDNRVWDEVWCYGTNGHLTMPTLGKVYFLNGQVLWTQGGTSSDETYKQLVPEEQLRVTMRKLYRPDWRSEYDPLWIIRSTNSLFPLGEEKALFVMEEFNRVEGLSDDGFWLLRTLYDLPKEHEHPYMGNPKDPYPGTPENAFTNRFPIYIAEGLPLNIGKGLPGSGARMAAPGYFDLYRKHGKFRTRKLRPPDDPFKVIIRQFPPQPGLGMGNNIGSFVITYGPWVEQTILLCRTVLDHEKLLRDGEYVRPNSFEEAHAQFKTLKCRWDDAKQLYIRGDGTHGPMSDYVQAASNRIRR